MEFTTVSIFLSRFLKHFFAMPKVNIEILFDFLIIIHHSTQAQS